MRIFSTVSGDYRVIQDFPFTPSDIMSAAYLIARDTSDVVFDWPVITDDEESGIWQIWFLVPEVDNSYLDHEVLV